jgi:hypothetical protein
MKTGDRRGARSLSFFRAARARPRPRRRIAAEAPVPGVGVTPFNLATKNRIPETEPIPEPKYPNRSGSVPVSEYPKYLRVIRFQASGNRISRISRNI